MSGIVLSLLIAFLAAKLGGELFARLGQPEVVGELVAGIVAGPAALGLIHPNATLTTVSTMGVIVLMFTVGLETRAPELFRVGRTAAAVAVLGVIVPFAAGYGFAAAYGFARPEALFVATALVATSVGVTARVLADKGLITSRSARIILAAAVVDDILGMLVLTVVNEVATGRAPSAAHLAVVAVEVVAFVAFEVLLAPRLVRRHGHLLDRSRIPNAALVVSIVLMLALAALSEAIGLAAIVGAFFAGMMLADTPERHRLDHSMRPLSAWLVPYFFVMAGAQVDIRSLAAPAVLVPGLILAVVATLSKVIGCGVGAIGEGRDVALAIGVGMVPRGEVGIVVVSAGLAAGVVTQPVYAMVVLMVALTTLIAPPFLPGLFARAEGDARG